MQSLTSFNEGDYSPVFHNGATTVEVVHISCWVARVSVQVWVHISAWLCCRRTCKAATQSNAGHCRASDYARTGNATTSTPRTCGTAAAHDAATTCSPGTDVHPKPHEGHVTALATAGDRRHGRASCVGSIGQGGATANSHSRCVNRYSTCCRH